MSILSNWQIYIYCTLGTNESSDPRLSSPCSSVMTISGLPCWEELWGRGFLTQPHLPPCSFDNHYFDCLIRKQLEPVLLLSPPHPPPPWIHLIILNNGTHGVPIWERIREREREREAGIINKSWAWLISFFSATYVLIHYDTVSLLPPPLSLSLSLSLRSFSPLSACCCEALAFRRIPYCPARWNLGRVYEARELVP